MARLLPRWDPQRLIQRKPFVAALVGGRKQGKSSAQADLLDQMGRSQFDLVLAFVGSAACNPVLEKLMATHWDPRFFFSEWDSAMIDKLLRQQEELRGAGIKREVCILVDDVVLASDARAAVAFGNAWETLSSFIVYGSGFVHNTA